MSRRTVGLLAFGEMGAGIAAAFTRAGIRVVGVLNGRSYISRERAIKAGVDDLADLGELVRQSEIVFSIIAPNAAVEVAQRVAELASRSRRDLMFVEANSVSKEKLKRIVSAFESSQVNLVDACIIGLPPNESRRPTFLVAGRDLEPLMSLDSIAFDITVLDDCVGRASAVKVTQDALSKGVNAFLTLVFLAAERQGILDTFVDVVSRSQPDLLARAQRSIPWIPADVDRFISEMDTVKEMLDGLDLPSSFASAARQILEIHRASRFAKETRRDRDVSRDFRETIIGLAEIAGKTGR